MAKDKKSFVLYCDYLSMFDELSDEEAGRLIKHIFHYCNDKNPEPPDRITKLVFEPIKQQLKRDLKNWESERSKRSESGKLGGIKSGESRRSRSKRSNASKNEANEAVTVTVNVNDTVIKKKDKKEIFRNDLVFPFASAEFNNTWNILIKEKKWKNKSPAALQKSLDLLGKYEEKDAVEMMNQTIMNNYQGLFEVKTKQNGIAKIGTSQSRINTAANW